MDKINLKLTLIALVLTLGILFLGNYAFDNYKVNHSLEKSLTEVNGVAEVETVKLEGEYQVKVKLEDTNNLQKIFTQIDNITKEELNNKKYQVILVSPENSQLTRVYDQIDLALYEALETGEFVKLGERIKSYADQYQLDQAEVNVDQDYIYLTLVEDKQQLYKVIERETSKGLGGESNG